MLHLKYVHPAGENFYTRPTVISSAEYLQVLAAIINSNGK